MRGHIAVWVPGMVVLVLILSSAVFSFSSLGRPFPGFLVYPNLLVAPLSLPGWLPPREGVVYPWALEGLDFVHLGSPADLAARLASRVSRETHIFSFRKGKEHMDMGLPVRPFRFLDLLGVCGPFFTSALVVLGIGLFSGGFLPATPASWSLSLACLSIAGWLGTSPDWMVFHTIPVTVRLIFNSVLPASLLHLVCLFPSPLPQITKHPSLTLLLTVPALLLFLLFYAFFPSPEGYAQIDSLDAVLTVLFLIVFGVRLARIGMASPHEKEGDIARMSLLKGLLPFGLACIPLGLLVYFFHVPYAMFAFATLLITLPPAAMAWALWKAGRA